MIPVVLRSNRLQIDGFTTCNSFSLITGKTHQIRAHLASIGHPLIGDFKYGDKKINQEMKQRFGLKDQLLHCTEIVFPRDMKTCKNLSGKKIQAPLPKRFDMIKNDLFGRA